MRPRLLLALLLATITGLLAASAATSARPAPIDDDEAALRKAGVKVDGDELLAYLRRQGGADEDLAGIDQLLRDLGAPAQRVRAGAADKLIALGPVALVRLRKAATETKDREVVRSAKRCVDRITKAWDYEQHRAAVRLLARRAGTSTTAAFLRHLPYVVDEEVEADIWYSLDAMAKKEIDPVFQKALASPFPSRRAVAGFILCRYGDKKQRDAAFGLLSDPDATVRLRTAQGMLGARNKAAVPTLIALLDQPSVALAWQAEELLHYTAGKASPKELVGAGAAKSRAECRKAWEAWWKAHGEKVDLKVRIGLPRMPGLVLLRLQYPNEKYWVALSGCNGPYRWELNSKSRVSDVSLLPGDRVLVSQWDNREWDGEEKKWKAKPGEVSECDLSGKTLWEYKGLTWPVACRRLPNGNTIVVDPSTWATFKMDGGRREELTEGVVEVTPEGARIFQRHMRPFQHYNENLAYPYILGNGRLFYRQDEPDFCGMSEHDLVKGGKVRDVPHQEKVNRGARIDPLGSGRYLIAVGKQVREVDAIGKTVWLYSCPAGEARRLRNGNTLMSYWRWPHHVIEVSPSKEVVWKAVTGEVSAYLHPCLPLVKLGFDGRE